MNKSGLIDSIASKAGLSKKDAKDALEATIATITQTLAKGENITLIGFGTFSTNTRAARTARIPGTTKEVQVPATTVAKFKVGKALKEAVK